VQTTVCGTNDRSHSVLKMVLSYLRQKEDNLRIRLEGTSCKLKHASSQGADKASAVVFDPAAGTGTCPENVSSIGQKGLIDLGLPVSHISSQPVGDTWLLTSACLSDGYRLGTYENKVRHMSCFIAAFPKLISRCQCGLSRGVLNMETPQNGVLAFEGRCNH
jgi:hypothetical protein